MLQKATRFKSTLVVVGLLLTVDLHTVASSIEDFNERFRLLPAPQKIEVLKGRALFCKDIRRLHLKGVKQRPAVDMPLYSLPLADSPGPGTVTLELSKSPNLPASPEGYMLEVTNGQLTIKATSEAGIFYGCQTLLQLMEDAKDQEIPIPACRITDYPGVAYRAVHWDLKYHLDNQKYYYDMIDRLARIKVNAVIVEFEDKLRYVKEPEVSAAHAISIQEFAAISRYARERHIEISPLVQGLGHVSFILKQDRYKRLRDNPRSDWVIDPLNPDTYRLQFALYEDAMEATPGGKYLHVGGDEVYNLGMSERSKKSGMSPIELQLYWLNKVCEFARAHNRTPIFWDDMVFSTTGLYGTMRNDGKITSQEVEQVWEQNQPSLEKMIERFPKDCIYMRWNYDFPKVAGNIKAIDWFHSHQLKVWGAPAAQDMSPMLPRQSSIYQPTKEFCEIATQKKIEGMLTTAWDDSSPHFETYWRGFHDFASLTWKYQDISAAKAHQTFRHRFYAPALGADIYEFQDTLETALNFWDTALINQGHRRHYPYQMDLIALPDPAKPGQWSARYQLKIERAAKELVRYKVIRAKIEKNQQLARRNHFALELLYTINELQVYPAQLLVLLDQFDKAAPGDKSSAKAAVIAHVTSFPAFRKQYEDVFSRTRFIANPEGYILDQNNDPMLANGTNNSDWMHVFELAINKNIQEWALSEQAKK